MKKIYIALMIISSSSLISSDNVSQSQAALNDSNRQESGGTVTPPTTGTPAESPMLRRTGRGVRLVDVPEGLNPEQTLARLNETRVPAQPMRLDFSDQHSDDMPVR